MIKKSPRAETVNSQVAPPLTDADAEKCALSCVFADEAKAAGYLEQLHARHFTDLRHEHIFEHLLSMEMDGRPLTPVEFELFIKGNGGVRDLGGREYVSALYTAAPSDENFPSYLNRLEDLAQRRRMITDAKAATRKALDLSQPIEPRPKSKLPPILDFTKFEVLELPEPPQVIHGILHRGCKLALGGGSKTFKTWTLLDLAMSVAYGDSWLNFNTTRGRVAYINLELPAWSLQSRMRAIANHKGIDLEPGWLSVWNLRGVATTYSEILPSIADELTAHNFSLLIIDPIYKLYGDTDENSARDISRLLNQFEALAQKTGAANAFASHFSKGNQAGKEAIDRISGSGVFARDPDAILTFTRHEQDGAFSVDSTLRNCATIDPFVVRWQYPLFVPDAQLDPSKLKKINGRPADYNPDDLRKILPPDGMLQKDWIKAALNDGMSRATFFRLKKALEQQETILQETVSQLWKPLNKH